MVQKTIFRWNLISKIASIFHETAKISSNKVHDSSLEIPCFSLYPTLSLITAKFPYDFNLNRKNLIMHLKTFLKLCLTRVLPFWNEWKKKLLLLEKLKLKKKKTTTTTVVTALNNPFKSRANEICKPRISHKMSQWHDKSLLYTSTQARK